MAQKLGSVVHKLARNCLTGIIVGLDTLKVGFGSLCGPHNGFGSLQFSHGGLKVGNSGLEVSFCGLKVNLVSPKLHLGGRNIGLSGHSGLS